MSSGRAKESWVSSTTSSDGAGLAARRQDTGPDRERNECRGEL